MDNKLASPTALVCLAWVGADLRCEISTRRLARAIPWPWFGVSVLFAAKLPCLDVQAIQFRDLSAQ